MLTAHPSPLKAEAQQLAPRATKLLTRKLTLMMGIEHFKKVSFVIEAGIVEMVPAPLKYELRIFRVEYLCFWGGDFASIPSTRGYASNCH